MIAHPKVFLHACRRGLAATNRAASSDAPPARVLPPAHRPTWLTVAGHLLLLAILGALVLLACLS